MEECAAANDIASANIEKLLAGEPSLTFNQLKKVAEYFGRGVLFFLEQTPVNDATVHSPQFRTLANQKPELSARIKALIERVEHQRTVYLTLREEVDDGNYPHFAPPQLDGLTAKQAAVATRTWLGLGPSNDFETYRQAIEAQMQALEALRAQNDAAAIEAGSHALAHATEAFAAARMNRGIQQALTGKTLDAL